MVESLSSTSRYRWFSFPSSGLLLRRLRWVAHPITVFVTLQVVWLAITLIWAIWFAEVGTELPELNEKLGSGAFDNQTVLAILIIGCVLLGVIFIGTIMLFAFGQKQTYLALQQRNFVSSVTHELKSPLASLQLTFETLNTREVDEETSATLRTMALSDIERLRRLVDRILVAGRLDRGMGIFREEIRQVDFYEVVEEAIQTISYLDPDISQRLEVMCEGSRTILTSRAALELIISNLLENAVKYSPRSSPIRIRVNTLGSETKISVEDEGIGLDRGDLKRVFKMFYRTESAGQKAVPGTGLGLYIVRSAVRQLGGNIHVESPGPGEGATFVLNLPQGVSYGN